MIIPSITIFNIILKNYKKIIMIGIIFQAIDKNKYIYKIVI